MLVLSRTLGEEVLIGRDITVRLVEIRGDTVRLGFTAPADVPIARRELCPFGGIQGRRGFGRRRKAEAKP